MQQFCFNWSLVGSTTIEAETLAEAVKKWAAIETNAAILESADATDFEQNECIVESVPGSGIFDTEVEI